MRKSITCVLLGLATTSLYALPDYDPFADATGSGGTSYAVGANLIGQTDAQGQSWFLAGPTSGSPVQPTISAGNLTISGLSSGGGNSVQLVNTIGAAGRFGIGSTITSGTVYFSMAMQLTSITSLSTSGVFWAGFNNTGASSSTALPSVVGTKLYTKAVAGGFNIGLGKSVTSSTDLVFDTSDVFTTSSVIFVVGSYTFNTSTGSDDVAQLWINPSSTSFGGTAPTPTLTDANDNDFATQIGSFVLFDRSATQPNSADIDDVRVGLTYGDVTPAVPEPATIVLSVLGLAGLFIRRAIRK